MNTVQAAGRDAKEEKRKKLHPEHWVLFRKTPQDDDEGKRSRLGIVAPKRSSLAYANAHRPFELFEKRFFCLLNRCRSAGPFGNKFRLKNKPVSLDTQ